MLKMIVVTLALTSLLLIHTEAKNRCDKDWDYFGYSCYFFSKNTLTWEEAADICNDHGAHLVRINNNKELRYLLKRVKATGREHYTDGTDSCSEGKWIWDSTNEKVVYAGWGRGEPNNVKNNEDCMAILPTFASNDVPCTIKFRYICEKKRKRCN